MAIPQNIERIVCLSPLWSAGEHSFFHLFQNGSKLSSAEAFPLRSRCCNPFPFHILSFSVCSPFSSAYSTTTCCLSDVCTQGFLVLLCCASRMQNGPQQGGGVQARVQRLQLLQRWRSGRHGARPMLHFPGGSHHTQPIVPPGREQQTHMWSWYETQVSSLSDCQNVCWTMLQV